MNIVHLVTPTEVEEYVDMKSLRETNQVDQPCLQSFSLYCFVLLSASVLLNSSNANNPSQTKPHLHNCFDLYMLQHMTDMKLKSSGNSKAPVAIHCSFCRKTHQARPLETRLGEP